VRHRPPRDGSEPEATLQWARGHFDGALARASEGGDAFPTLGPVALEKVLESYCDCIGDIEQQLPGEKLDYDPLLRRSYDEVGS
jgi:hypothetical protein